MSTTGTCFTRPTPTATGAEAAWQNVGIDYTFAANGQLSPAVERGRADERDRQRRVARRRPHRAQHRRHHPIRRFERHVQVNLLQQNGYAAGQLQSVAVSDKGRIVGTYSNGRTIDLAEITLATFNGANMLKRFDGGAFEATAESGAADLRRAGQDHRLVAGRLEHRYRRRVHQADRHAAGLLGQYQGDHHHQPDGSGPPEHAAVAAAVRGGRDRERRAAMSLSQALISAISGLKANQAALSLVAGQRRQCRHAGLCPQDGQSGRDVRQRHRHRRAHQRHPARARSICAAPAAGREFRRGLRRHARAVLRAAASGLRHARLRQRAGDRFQQFHRRVAGAVDQPGRHRGAPRSSARRSC